MKKTCVTIDPSSLRIGSDAPFRFRLLLPGEEGQVAGYPTAGSGRRIDDEALVESVRRCGVIHPPLLLEEPSDGPSTIVCGYRRIAAAQAAGIDAIDALSIEAAPADVIPLWLEEAGFGAPLSDLELVLLISKYRALSGDAFDSGRLSDIAGRNLSLSYIEKVLRLLELPGVVLDALHDGRLSTGDLLLLMESRAIDTARAAGLIAGAALKRAERREAVRLLLRLGDLRIFEDFEERYSTREDREAPETEEIDLMTALRAACNPSLERDLGRIEEIVTRLGLPTGASLQPPENLEGGHYRVTARIRTERDLEELLDKLRAALDRGDIGRLFDILRGSG